MSRRLDPQDALARAHPDASALQRVGAFARIPELVRALGADPDAVLSRAGVSPGDIRHRDDRVPYAVLGKLLLCASRATQNPQFGLLAGRLWHLDDLGLVGSIVRNSATVGDALRVWTVYQHLNSGGGVTVLVRRAAVVDFGYAIYHPDVTGADQICDAVLAGGVNFMRELCGPGFSPTEVFLAHDKRGNTRLYRDMFKVMPHFDAELCALRFPAYWLDRRIEGADPERLRAALAAAHRAGPPQLLQQVYRALRTLLLTGKSSGDDLAQLLAMHRRTLNRRLQAAGTTFQKVLDEVRFQVARQLLTDSELALDDIAGALGYATVSTFMRSFRRHTGSTPGKWRRIAQRERAAIAAPVASGPRPTCPMPMPSLAPLRPWIGPTRAPEAQDNLARDDRPDAQALRGAMPGPASSRPRKPTRAALAPARRSRA